MCYVFIIDLVNFLIEIDWADEVEEWKKKKQVHFAKKKVVTLEKEKRKNTRSLIQTPMP